MNFRKLIDKHKLAYHHACETLKDEEENIDKLSVSLDRHEKALAIVQLVAQSVEQAVHSKIAGVVSECLEAVFDDPYEFLIRFERKRNRTEAVLAFERDGLEVDPLSASGGGAVDVAAFALRVACISMQRDLEQVMILDEPFRFVSKEYRPRVRSMIETLSKRLGMQFVIVTHMDILKTGKVIEL